MFHTTEPTIRSNHELKWEIPDYTNTIADSAAWLVLLVQRDIISPSNNR